MDTIELHFHVDGAWLTYFVRGLYHYEDKPEKALEVLNTLDGLKMSDAYAVINGDASFGNDGDLISLILEPDEKFKKGLAKHLKFKEDKKKQEIEEEIKYRESLSDLLDRYGKYGTIRSQMGLREDPKSPVFSDKEIDARNFYVKRDKFEYFAESACDWCKKKETCGELLYYCKDLKEHLIDVKFSEPYKMKWSEFSAGKPRLNPHQFKADDDIEVVNLYTLPVRKTLLDGFVNIVIDRMRVLQRKGSGLYRFGGAMWISSELEKTRRDLHGELLLEAGYDYADMSHGAQFLRTMIEKHLEDEAKKWGVME